MENNNNQTGEYLLLMRGLDWDKDLSPEEVQANMTQFMAWVDKITADGKLKGAQPLTHEGKVISGANGRSISDGPYAESKEAVGGYFILTVADMDEAMAIAKSCPSLEYGAIIEVRPIAAICPTMQKAQDLLAAAAGK